MKHRYSTPFIITLVAVSLIASPLAYAKDKGRDSDGDHGQAHVQASVQVQTSTSTDSDSDRGCIRAFGHLIAPGWIKHNGSVSLESECAFPWGIGRIFGKGHHENHRHGTTTPPITGTTTPVVSISNTAITVGTTTAHLSWKTNVNADSEAYYATTSPVVIGASSTSALANSSLTTTHSLDVNSLSTSTTYYGLLKSVDSGGNTAVTGQFSFTTGI